MLFCYHDDYLLGLNLKTTDGEECYDISMCYAAGVGANSFAHNSLSMRMNSHLQPHHCGFQFELSY